MMFHRVAVSKIPQQAVKKAAVVKATRSLASAAVPASYMPIEEDNNEAGDVVVVAAVEDSFAFYPVQKNRIQGMYKPNHEAARECFSFYPSNGIIVETQNPITQIATAATKTTAAETVASTKTKMNDDIISKDEWRSLIEERLMNVKSNPIAAAAAASTTTVGVVDDSFAFYPVQSNRVQTQVTKEERECFSFYPSSNGQQQEIKAAAFDTTTTAEEEEAEVISVRHNFADGVPAHVKDQVKTSEFFGEKKESFEDFTPSPTEWSSITIMQALNNVKKTTTTFAVSAP